jgi:hypothetical protein
MPATAKKQLSVYLTHAPIDAAQAEPVRQALFDAGFIVREPPAGDVTDAARASRDVLRDTQALVVLLTPSLLRSTQLPIELGMTLAWGIPVFVLLVDVARREVPAFLWNNLAVPADRLSDVIHALDRIGEPISDDQREALANAYLAVGVPVDQLMTDVSVSERIAEEFRRATRSQVPTANLLRELLKLRKRGQLPRLRASA